MVSETCVRMAVLAGTKTAIMYQLLYGEVKEISVRTKNDLFPLDNSRFGDWGYDELLSAGRHAFRHNILFQTGTEISITFGSFEFTRRKASVDKLKHYAVASAGYSASNQTVQRHGISH